jgi:hypothetical protein
VAIELIDLGTVAQDGADGDLAREAFIKVNANFTELDLATVTQAEAEAGVSTTKRAWTAQRVAQAVRGGILTGLSLAVGGAITATDTVLSSLGKLQKQITDAATNLASNVRNTALTGYAVGANAALAATDTVLAAFGKVQAQINSLSSSKLDVGATAVAASTLTGLTASVGELNYTDGVTSNIQTQLNTKAPLASPPLTGVPTAPTAAVNTNTTQLATTAFVNAEIANDAPTKTGDGASGTWGVSVTGNAATATALQTARTINGVSFNGTANITVADTTKQPLDATLTALAGVTTSADKIIYATGADTFATATLTAQARALLDDVDQAAQRGTLGLGSAATRTALGTTGSLYSRDSILGTVSQSSGVPTGAIIERGSNANGEYVRYADGTQICTHALAGGTTVTSSYTLQGITIYRQRVMWTFPAAFIATPVVGYAQGQNVDDTFQAGKYRTNSATAATFDSTSFTSFTSFSNLPGVVSAVGRWF